MTERWTPGPVEWPSLRTRTHAHYRINRKMSGSHGLLFRDSLKKKMDVILLSQHFAPARSNQYIRTPY